MENWSRQVQDYGKYNEAAMLKELCLLLQWYINRKTAIFDDGQTDSSVCCSDKLVSMHYVSPGEMHRLHFLAS